ncbi:MAG: hypothetical protein ACREJB_10915 [Planctomycetaceae bacterium]
MQRFHGALLIGGMALKDLDGEIETAPDADAPADGWCGRFALERTEVRCLQVGRPYRLELDDGRAAQVIVSRMNVPIGHLKLLIEFAGQSPLD